MPFSECLDRILPENPLFSEPVCRISATFQGSQRVDPPSQHDFTPFRGDYTMLYAPFQGVYPGPKPQKSRLWQQLFCPGFSRLVDLPPPLTGPRPPSPDLLPDLLPDPSPDLLPDLLTGPPARTPAAAPADLLTGGPGPGPPAPAGPLPPPGRTFSNIALVTPCRRPGWPAPLCDFSNFSSHFLPTYTPLAGL